MNTTQTPSDNGKPARPARRREPQPATPEAHRRAAVILEVLAGIRTVKEASATLGICTNHYYLLERKALGGLVAACQVQPKGKRIDPDKQVASLERALERSQRECQRQAALVRATQQAVGLPITPTEADPPARSRRRGSKDDKAAGRRKRKASVRALRAAERLSEKTVANQETAAVEQTDTAREADRNLPSLKERNDGA